MTDSACAGCSTPAQNPDRNLPTLQRLVPFTPSMSDGLIDLIRRPAAAAVSATATALAAATIATRSIHAGARCLRAGQARTLVVVGQFCFGHGSPNQASNG